MIGGYKIITLCGSTKFKDEYQKLHRDLTLSGNIVLSTGVFAHSEGLTLEYETLDMLVDMHRVKINMSDEIMVINKDGYIGSSTKSEIEYAKSQGKTIRYLENPPDYFDYKN